MMLFNTLNFIRNYWWYGLIRLLAFHIACLIANLPLLPVYLFLKKYEVSNQTLILLSIIWIVYFPTVVGWIFKEFYLNYLLEKHTIEK